jgi:hypothetical protein
VLAAVGSALRLEALGAALDAWRERAPHLSWKRRGGLK